MDQLAPWLIGCFLIGFVLVEIVLFAFLIPKALPLFARTPPFEVRATTVHDGNPVIRFPTGDGLTLAGRFFRTPQTEPRGVILFGPEYLANHASALYYAPGLLEAGFDVFAFDFRGQGDSDSQTGYSPLYWVTEFEVTDFLAAVEFVAKHPRYRDLPLGAFGVSRGGGAALLAAARESRIQSVAADSAFSTSALMHYYTRRWGHLFASRRLVDLLPHWQESLILAAARKVCEWKRRCRFANFNRLLPLLADRPVLLIAGERDHYAPVEIAREMADRIGGNADVSQVPDAKHNGARNIDAVEYDSLLVKFFTQMTHLPEVGGLEAAESPADLTASGHPLSSRSHSDTSTESH